MNDFTPEPDPLGELLAPPAAETPGLRPRLADATAALLRRRRRLRRLARVAALVACCVACFAAGRFTPRAGPLPAAKAEPAPKRPEAPPPLPAGASAVALEWSAVDAPSGRVELFRRAAARYLTVEADPLGAARCYGRALDEGGPEDLAIGADDDWLLLAIKDARQTEKRHAKGD
jgi:hypothetical protein